MIRTSLPWLTFVYIFTFTRLPASIVLAEPETLKILIIDGQNNHNWRATTPILRSFLEKSERFRVDVVTTPSDKNASPKAWNQFDPDFSKYDVVLSNYNGSDWPDTVQKSFVTYVTDGGGVMIIHAANNAFPEWTEYNQMIGLGWRGASFGYRLAFNDRGSLMRTPIGKGLGAGHGQQHDFPVIVREPRHPVMRRIPRAWLHAKDELYHGQRGPATDMHVLATAFSDPQTGGSGDHEPLVWWIPYGQGKIFTTVMGHSEHSMTCVGFQTIVTRGCEWAATGKVTLEFPENFPSIDKTSTSEFP